jgi:hypothetical protein
MSIETDKQAFLQAKTQHGDQARQTAALFILCGIDLAQGLRSDGEERMRLVARLRRMIERERLKGVNRHWNYDLNRHIALKQALDRLKAGLSDTMSAAPQVQ